MDGEGRMMCRSVSRGRCAVLGLIRPPINRAAPVSVAHCAAPLRSAVPVCLTDCAAVHPLGRAALVAGNERVSTVCLSVVHPLFV